MHIELLDARTEVHVLNAYKKGIEFFKAKGLEPNVQRLDNEPSFLTAAFQAFQNDEDISVDRVPPGQHRRNKAERGIETGKHHIIAAMAGTDPAFPMKAVKYLMPQIELTLNLLHQSKKDPSMSAWEQLHGKYDFNASAMRNLTNAPLGQCMARKVSTSAQQLTITVVMILLPPDVFALPTRRPNRFRALVT